MDRPNEYFQQNPNSKNNVLYREKNNELGKISKPDDKIELKKVWIEEKGAKNIYVLKMFLPKDNVDFNRELRFITFLQKIPGIIKVNKNYEKAINNYELANEKKFIIVMEEGKTSLNEVLQLRKNQGKEYTEDEILYILYEIMKTFNEMHELKITHSDIKPDNILLVTSEENSNKFHYKIIDFECSTKEDSD